MDRRRFNKICGSLIGGAASVHFSAGTAMGSTPYPNSRLVYEDDTAVSLDSLKTGNAYIFGYPYITTPCFLIKLSRSAPAHGSWPGGLGKDQSIVAFSAICSHKMSHPAKPISHISYREQPVRFHDATGQEHSRDGVISCCSERSVYDPANAGQVLAGPAPVPLAAIVLSHDEQGNISATGSFGDDQYERFLTKFGFRLAMEYGVTDVRARSGEQSTCIPANSFSEQQVLC